MSATPSLRHSTHRLLGTAPAVLFGCVVGYLILNWVSFIHPMRGFYITPWNPQSALLVAMLWWRPSAWWLVMLSVWTGQTLLRDVVDFWPAEFVACGLLTLGYIATAAGLRRWLNVGGPTATRRDFVVFTAVAVAGALLAAALYVLGLAAFGVAQPDRVVTAIMRAWVGDAVGFVVTLPLLLALASHSHRRRSAAMLRTTEAWLVALVAVVCAYAVFARPAEEQFKFFYLLFIPVVWGAARFGVIGAIWSSAFVQLLLIVAVQSAEYRPLTVFELQMLMAALAATGLLLGTTVDERESAAQALRASLHLAAAGDMAAALAHELNQPLTALSNYARASQLLARRMGDDHQLSDVADKLVEEANRASEVVKRLRDFFRSRRSELRPTEIEPLVRSVIEAQADRAASMGVVLDCTCQPGLPLLRLDRVQMEVVLRNLVANGIDASVQSPSGEARVSVEVSREGAAVIVAVHDSGSGVAAEELLGVFESRASSKPGGMGIGLGISRSLVQAHGGKLWAEPGPGGRFLVSLPIEGQAP